MWRQCSDWFTVFRVRRAPPPGVVCLIISWFPSRIELSALLNSFQVQVKGFLLRHAVVWCSELHVVCFCQWYWSRCYWGIWWHWAYVVRSVTGEIFILFILGFVGTKISIQELIKDPLDFHLTEILKLIWMEQMSKMTPSQG